MTTADTTKTGYHIKGDFFEACSCANICPCAVGADPDDGQCWTFTGYHISEGTIREVDVSNLSVVSLSQVSGNMIAGNWREVLFVDGSATDAQAQALLDAFQGHLGGALAELAAMVGERVATYRTAIEYTSGNGKGSIRVTSPQGQGYAIEASMEAYRGPDGNPTQLVNSIASSILGNAIVVGKASSDTVSLPEHQMQWSYSGRGAMQGQFDLRA